MNFFISLCQNLSSGYLTLCLLVATCHILTTFVNSLDIDQDQQNVGPDLDPNCLTLIAFLKDFFEKVHFEKSANDKKT